MGMSNTDDEFAIRKQHDMEELYKRVCPYDSPRPGASEDERAFWSERVRKFFKDNH